MYTTQGWDMSQLLASSSSTTLLTFLTFLGWSELASEPAGACCCCCCCPCSCPSVRCDLRSEQSLGGGTQIFD